MICKAAWFSIRRLCDCVNTTYVLSQSKFVMGRVHILQKDAVTFLSYLGIAIFFIGSHPIMPPCDLIKRLPYDRPWFTVGIIAGSFPSPVPWFCATSSTYFWSSILYHRESAGLKSTFPAATVTHLLNRRKTTIAIIHDMLINSGKLFQMVPGSQSYKCESLRLSP
jgi:hypothetical protein